MPAQSRRAKRLASRNRWPLEFSEAERGAADWAWQHDQPAGAGTGTLPFGRWWWWPLSVEDGPLALLGVCAREGQTLSGQRRRLLTALSQPLAQALARAQLADDLEAARLHGETEQLRSALLASVSHDLRTPLTSMRGSIDSLLALGKRSRWRTDVSCSKAPAMKPSAWTATFKTCST